MNPVNMPLRSLVSQYLQALTVRNYSPETVTVRGRYIRYFLEWCESPEILDIEDITPETLFQYSLYLRQYKRKDNDQPLSPDSQCKRLAAIKCLFEWLYKQGHTDTDVASHIDLPKIRREAPEQVLSAREAELILSQPDLEESYGIRDRAILETLYSTAIRRMEIVNLHIYDLDLSQGILTIRQGKGKKDRLVPIGARALRWIDKYLTLVRPELVKEPDSQVLFLGRRGGGLSRDTVSALVGKYVQMAGLKGSCHLFRHSAATLMLEGGADVQIIQKILGHSSLLTTQGYTKVDQYKLKEIHQKTHPSPS